MILLLSVVLQLWACWLILRTLINHRLVETHIFSFVVGRAFVTDIEKLKISSKTRSLDVLKVLQFFSEVTKVWLWIQVLYISMNLLSIFFVGFLLGSHLCVLICRMASVLVQICWLLLKSWCRGYISLNSNSLIDVMYVGSCH